LFVPGSTRTNPRTISGSGDGVEERIREAQYGRAHDLNGVAGKNEAKWRDWDWIAFVMLAAAVLLAGGVIALVILGNMGVIGQG
jgi:hypothetical protein